VTTPPPDPYATPTPPPQPGSEAPDPSSPYPSSPYQSSPYPTDPSSSPQYPTAPYPPGYQPYPAYQPPAKRETDGFAIAALVLAILAIVPVAVVLAIVALGRIKRTGNGGRGLAIAALVVSAAWFVLGLIAAVLLYAFRDEISDAIETQLRYDDYVSELSVGDCIDYEPGLFEDDTAVEPEEPFLQIVDCSGEHQEEVIALPVMAGDSYPGDEAVDAQVEEECLPAFESYVGLAYEESIYDITWFAPSEETWADGDRQILCTVYDPAGPVDQSIRGSAE
jgi:hypothetical protein